MDKTKHTEVTSEDLRKAFEGESSTEKSDKTHAKEKHKKSKKFSEDKKLLIFLIIGIVGLIGGVAMISIALFLPKDTVSSISFPIIPSKTAEETTYSPLTGMPLDNADLAKSPVYCVQTPNGTDGARPQSGINEAGVVFEAIAEAGITRFAAIYQNPTTSVIGPIRSLRMYYLEWDTPFNCTVVHAGGADDAIAALRAGGYGDLDESYTYMYRGTYGARRWNNLFTTSSLLKKYSADSGKNSSEVKGFTRMTPEESEKSRALASADEILDITTPAKGDTSKTSVKTPSITMNFGGVPNYNPHYEYDVNTNTYVRSYTSGVSHDVYHCKAEDLGKKNPEDVCTLGQLTPSVVIAMMVAERRASDNYHENIDAIGSGDAYIFQNGTAIKGAWKKTSREDQIKFTDTDGKEIKLAPGQTFISAVPNYGSVEY